MPMLFDYIVLLIYINEPAVYLIWSGGNLFTEKKGERNFHLSALLIYSLMDINCHTLNLPKALQSITKIIFRTQYALYLANATDAFNGEKSLMSRVFKFWRNGRI